MYIILVTWVLHASHSEEGKWHKTIEVYPKPKFYVLSSNLPLLCDQLAVLENRHEKSYNHIAEKGKIGKHIQVDEWPVLDLWQESQSKWENEGSDHLENQEDHCICRINGANQWEKTFLRHFSIKVSFHV